MADPADPVTDDPEVGKLVDDETLPESVRNAIREQGKKAIEAERKARRDAEKELKDLRSELQSLKDKDLSEVDQLRGQIGELTKERDEQNARALRLEVATAKGLTPAQAKRLVGTTQEELEADADEILEAFPAKTGATPPPTNKPTPSVNGGGGQPPALNDDSLESALKNALGIK